jgi:rod shape-determining protein MreD
MTSGRDYLVTRIFDDDLPKFAYSLIMLFPLSLDHMSKYALFWAAHFLMFFADIQILPLFLTLNVMGIFYVASIYYWSIYRPSLWPAWLLFVTGLVKDMILGLPYIGLNSLVFITIYMIVRNQRTFLSGQGFFMIWAGYGLVCLLTCFIFWIALCLYLAATAPYVSLSIEFFVMILSFPLIISVMGLLHKMLPFAPQDKNTL